MPYGFWLALPTGDNSRRCKVGRKFSCCFLPWCHESASGCSPCDDQLPWSYAFQLLRTPLPQLHWAAGAALPPLATPGLTVRAFPLWLVLQGLNILYSSLILLTPLKIVPSLNNLQNLSCSFLRPPAGMLIQRLPGLASHLIQQSLAASVWPFPTFQGVFSIYRILFKNIPFSEAGKICFP